MQELVDKHLQNVGHVTSPDIYADDVIMDFPYAPEHHSQGLDGKVAVLRFLDRVGEFFTGYTIEGGSYTGTTDPNVFVVEYSCTATNNETQAFYEQHYVAFVRLENGKIKHIREYYNPIEVLVAFGEIERPVG